MKVETGYPPYKFNTERRVNKQLSFSVQKKLKTNLPHNDFQEHVLGKAKLKLNFRNNELCNVLFIGLIFRSASLVGMSL